MQYEGNINFKIHTFSNVSRISLVGTYISFIDHQSGMNYIGAIFWILFRKIHEQTIAMWIISLNFNVPAKFKLHNLIKHKQLYIARRIDYSELLFIGPIFDEIRSSIFVIWSIFTIIRRYVWLHWQHVSFSVRWLLCKCC